MGRVSFFVQCFVERVSFFVQCFVGRVFFFSLFFSFSSSNVSWTAFLSSDHVSFIVSWYVCFRVSTASTVYRCSSVAVAWTSLRLVVGHRYGWGTDRVGEWDITTVGERTVLMVGRRYGWGTDRVGGGTSLRVGNGPCWWWDVTTGGERTVLVVGRPYCERPPVVEVTLLEG